MARSILLSRLTRLMRIARFSDREGLSTREGLEKASELEWARAREIGRRGFLIGAGAAGAAIAAANLYPRRAWANSTSNARIAVIGSGIAGLVCADHLARRGMGNVVVYEANPGRTGGRIWSRQLGSQWCEAGGELIDNLHKTMLGYANEFGLAKEDYGKEPGELAYWFAGRNHSEEEVVEEWRIAEQRMQDDLHGCSYPTFFSHTDFDVRLDNTSMAEYLDQKCGDLPLIRGVLEQSYIAEYGREMSEQSVLNMLLFIHLDRRSRFLPYGVFSDERYHLVGGNSGITRGIAERLPNPVQHGAQLTALSREAGGDYLLYFNGGTAPERAKAVVLAIPFSTLRRVTLDPSLGLSADKLRAINELGYGYNAKMMIRFSGRPWADHGSNGSAYADLPNVQNTWETNYSQAAGTGILTDYSGGNRGAALQRGTDSSPMGCGSCHPAPSSAAPLQANAELFLSDLDKVYPGARAAAAQPDGKYLLTFGHWLTNPYARASYTCYTPGQFTNLCGLEAQPCDLLKFAGEHVNSFYEWQGFMEGGALSGIAAADALYDDCVKGKL